ncbi:MAG TPA: pseudaminic acid synthase [Desulfobacterales bacterium]|nr:pseudaminic acid synthase [Desulfobacterales bacterium]
MNIKIGSRNIGSTQPVYIVAEMSANHNHDFSNAVDIIKAVKEAGADAVKLQTYTPDTITIDCDNNQFQIKNTTWEGKSLYQLYREAYTPWEWQPKLQEVALSLDIDFFSTPFDNSAVDFLEEMRVPAYKIASFELVDLPLLKRIGATGKPVILSTGMASLAEIDEAMRTLEKYGAGEIILLKCVSAYPAAPESMNLKTIPNLASTFGTIVGLSDHTLNSTAAIAAVALGASVIEKHITLSRRDGGIDSSFSLDPDEFKNMVEAIRITEKSLGEVNYGPTETEAANRIFRRSLFVVENIKAGETFSTRNTRSIRPGHGLHTRYMDNVLGRKAACDIERGTPLSWKLIGGL